MVYHSIYHAPRKTRLVPAFPQLNHLEGEKMENRYPIPPNHWIADIWQ